MTVYRLTVSAVLALTLLVSVDVFVSLGSNPLAALVSLVLWIGVISIFLTDRRRRLP